MALRFVDSFDHYGFFMPKWTNTRNGSGAAPDAGVGRFGTKGMHISDSWVGKQLDDQPTWILGTAMFTVAGVGDSTLFTFRDGVTTQCSVVVTATGNIVLYRGTSTLLGSVAIPHWAFNRSFYVEAAATIDNSAGAMEVHVDGASIISLTSQDTQVTANAFANYLYFGDIQFGGFPPGHLDDAYICDGTGSAPTNTFLGDTRIEARFPNGNGAFSDFVGSDANSVDNYLLVDEVVQDDDTTYVESDNVGDEDTYTFQDMTATSGTVYGVQLLPWARKTDAGVRKIASVARLAGTDEDSADQTLSTTYDYYPDIRETKPGGGAWSVSDFNSAEFGPKVTV